MNGRQSFNSNNRPTCRQPWCPMRRSKFAAEDIAEVILRDIAGDSAKSPFSEDRRITPGPYCRACIGNVIRGKNVFHTEAEWRQLDAAGRWHHRRDRRLRARESRRI